MDSQQGFCFKLSLQLIIENKAPDSLLHTTATKGQKESIGYHFVPIKLIN